MSSLSSAHYCPFTLDRFSFQCLSEITISRRRIGNSIYDFATDLEGNTIPCTDSEELSGFFSHFSITKECVNGRYYYVHKGKHYLSVLPEDRQLKRVGFRNWKEVFPFLREEIGESKWY